MEVPLGGEKTSGLWDKALPRNQMKCVVESLYLESQSQLRLQMVSSAGSNKTVSFVFFTVREEVKK